MSSNNENSNQLELTHSLLFRESNIGIFENTEIRVSDPTPITIDNDAMWQNLSLRGGFMYHQQPEAEM